MRQLAAVAALAILVVGMARADEEQITASVAPQWTVLIKGGKVIDGTGAPAVEADVLVKGDRIAAIGPNLESQVDEVAFVIDARGKVVTPGFIDTHSHGDPLETPGMANFLAMGVTTICLGQDGSSPRVGGMQDWMTRVDETRPGVNVIMYVGHGTVRTESGVGLSKTPSAEDIARMADLVEQGMQLGCFGMTTGLEYQPGMFSEMDELVAVGIPVARHGGIIMSHLRDEDDPTLKATMGELLEQGRRSGAPVHVSHMKCVYGKGAARAEEILAWIDEARAAGQVVTADIYPYTASYTGIGILFPEWALPPNNYQEVVASRRGELADYLRNRVNLRNGPEATLFGSRPYTGKTLAQAAAEQEKPFEEILIELGPRGGSAAYFVMNEELQTRLYQAPYVNVCSDGSPTGRHPRGHGSFAKIIRAYVNENGVFTLEEAVRKMSGLAAETIGLVEQQRGMLKVGWAADILVFDPAEVRDTATFEEPIQLAEGFDTILINGAIINRDDLVEGSFARNGRMLRKK